MSPLEQHREEVPALPRVDVTILFVNERDPWNPERAYPTRICGHRRQPQAGLAGCSLRLTHCRFLRWVLRGQAEQEQGPSGS